MPTGIYKLKVKIGGKDYSDKIPYGFISFSLKQNIEKHHYLELAFRSDTFNDNLMLNNNVVEFIGEKIELALQSSLKDNSTKVKKLIFTGVVSGIDISNSHKQNGNITTLTAFSPDFALADGLNCKSFSDIKLKDIVQNTITEYNLICKTKTKPSFHKKLQYTVQYNESAFSFLRRLAHRFGQWFFYDGQQLFFGELEKGKSIELRSGENLLSFKFLLSAKPFDFEFVNYDYKDDGKQLFKSKDKQQQVKFGKWNNKVKKQSENIFDHHSLTFYNEELPHNEQQSHLDEKVAIRKEKLGNKMFFCEGSSDCPELKLGSLIKISEKNNGNVIDHGTFIIIGIKHFANRNGEYENVFKAIPSDCKTPVTADPFDYPKAETQSAIVIDNEDPDNFGRVAVRFFWQNDGQKTPWLRIINPYAGSDKGHFFIPEKDEEVIVSFEGGNAEKPYVIGSVYHAKAFPESWKQDNNNIKAIRTRSGHTIEFDDKEGEEEIRIYDYKKENYFIKLKTHKQEITIEAKEHIKLKAKNISFIAEKDLKIEATDISFKANGNISSDITGNLKTKTGGNISNEATANINIKAGAKAAFKAGAQLEQKAPVIKIN